MAQLRCALWKELELQLGKWTTRDPAGYVTTPLTLYAYVSSMPIAFLDPSGLSGCKLIGSDPAEGGVGITCTFKCICDNYLPGTDLIGTIDIPVFLGDPDEACEGETDTVRKDICREGGDDPPNDDICPQQPETPSSNLPNPTEQVTPDPSYGIGVYYPEPDFIDPTYDEFWIIGIGRGCLQKLWRCFKPAPPPVKIAPPAKQQPLPPLKNSA